MGPTYHRRGSLQLWQFLLALLNDPANQSAIVWTGRGMEFKLIEPEEVSVELSILRTMTKFNSLVNTSQCGNLSSIIGAVYKPRRQMREEGGLLKTVPNSVHGTI